MTIDIVPVFLEELRKGRPQYGYLLLSRVMTPFCTVYMFRKSSAVKGVKSGCTVKGIYGWWSEVELKCSEVK
jgi:hypothetical protein